MRFLLVNGPNLNLLGHREPDLYGSITLKSIENDLREKALLEGVELDCFQSNSEGEMITCIHNSVNKNTKGILINAGAYTHTSIALRDALVGVKIPYVEVHLTNTYARESFRHGSYLSEKAIAVVSGFGAYSYELGFRGLLNFLRARK
tara:strand:- start:183 stop:626 length:444 start_codon:yes stop_codon:yes gene_type:complete